MCGHRTKSGNGTCIEVISTLPGHIIKTKLPGSSIREVKPVVSAPTMETTHLLGLYMSTAAFMNSHYPNSSMRESLEFSL